MAAFTPLTRVVGYAPAKAGVSNFTRWLAVHMAQEYTPNIRVNALASGFIIGKQNKALLLNEDGSLKERVNSLLTIRRWAGLARPMSCSGRHYGCSHRDPNLWPAFLCPLMAASPPLALFSKKRQRWLNMRFGGRNTAGCRKYHEKDGDLNESDFAENRHPGCRTGRNN